LTLNTWLLLVAVVVALEPLVAVVVVDLERVL
jgi:hypothetical protein